jgi:hypothetical protein
VDHDASESRASEEYFAYMIICSLSRVFPSAHSARRRFWSLAVIMDLTVASRQTLSMSTPGDSSAIRRMCAELWLVVFEEVITTFDTWGRVCRRNKRVIPLLSVCKDWKVNVRPHRYIDKTLTVPGT